MKKIIVLLLCSLVFIPVIRADESGISVKSESGIIMEASTGKVLFEKEADTPKAPASMTKIMTMLLIMEAIDDGRLSMDDQVNISKNASGMGGSQAYLEENTTSKVSTLLTAIAIGSANDASVAMAEKIGGTEENFVNMMNKRAKEMGAENQQAQIFVKESDEIVRKLSLKSSQGGYKIMIIWLPEKMNVECSNKLLKLLEEPPAMTVFLLVSEEPDAILQTIQSRTQRFNIHGIKEPEISKVLQIWITTGRC